MTESRRLQFTRSHAAASVAVAGVILGCATPADPALPNTASARTSEGPGPSLAPEVLEGRVYADASDPDFPIVPITPATAAARRGAPDVEMVGASPTSQNTWVRVRPEPLLYGLLTGHEPFNEDNRRRRVRIAKAKVRPARADADAEQESARSEALENEIMAELLRQEALLEQMEEENEQRAMPPEVVGENLSERADPRSAPATPTERSLPMAIFDNENMIVPANTWGNSRRLEVVRRTLDADQDGAPEQVRYYTRRDEQLLRIEKDRNYDGRIDTWDRYEDGQLVARTLDENDDGKPDNWQKFEGDRMTTRVIDRDYDGVKDAFYSYQQGLLVEERHDPDNDGAIEIRSRYRDRHRVETVEDRSGDNVFDTFTTYHVVDGQELVAKVESDTTGDGKRNLIETYVAAANKAVLAKREEDKTGDGTMDITSIYEKGRLVRREVSDPSLIP